VSLGRFTTETDVDYLVEKLAPVVERLRSMNPLYEKTVAELLGAKE
jgi:cysteine desulfurase